MIRMRLYYLFLDCKYTLYISICMSCLFAPAIALHLQYICGTGPADVPHEGGDDKVHVDEAAISPQGQQKCGLWDQQMSSKKLDKFFFPWRECTGIPQYGSSCLLEG